MTLSVSRFQLPMGQVNVNSSGFRNLIENHVLYLQTSVNTKILILDPADEDKWQGDFYGLLNKLGITQDMWWITMRVNNLYSPVDYSGDLGQIYSPGIVDITTLLSRYLATATVK